jgi:AcrR family transcriptional regulator
MGYDDRRFEVAQAAWRVIVQEGLDRTSMRAIAQELGSSTGVITHYFRDKEELILFALEQVVGTTLDHMKACAEHQQGIDRLEQMIVAALPLEDSDRNDWKVWIAFMGYSIGRDRLIQQHQKRYNRIRQILYQELADLKAARLIRADLDLTLEASPFKVLFYLF